jgi:putative endonuclease
MKVEKANQEVKQPKSSGWRITFGKLGEAQAVRLLKQQGWRIEATNWRCGRLGEIDIIARTKQGLLVFLEVKSRLLKTAEAGLRNDGFESVHRQKQRKILMCAAIYINRFFPHEQACRFDVIAVEYDRTQEEHDQLEPKPLSELVQEIQPAIRHIEGAFF